MNQSENGKESSNEFFKKCKELSESPELKGGIIQEVLNVLSRNTVTMKIETQKEGEEFLLNMNDEEKALYVLADFYNQKIEKTKLPQSKSFDEFLASIENPEIFLEAKRKIDHFEKKKLAFRNLMHESIKTRLGQEGKKIPPIIGIRDNFIVVSALPEKQEQSCNCPLCQFLHSEAINNPVKS